MATEGGEKTGGRQPGSGNRVNALLRTQIQDIVESQLDQLMVDLEFMKPKERADTVVQLMKFVMPTLKAVEFEDTTPKEKAAKFQFIFVDKSQYSADD